MSNNAPTNEQLLFAARFYEMTLRFLRDCLNDLNPTKDTDHLNAIGVVVSMEITKSALDGSITEEQADFLAKSLNSAYEYLIEERKKEI